MTRAEEKAESLRTELSALGADVLSVPTVRHELTRDMGPFAECVEVRRLYSYVVFTSQTAVRFFLEAATALGAPPAAWSASRIAAVGARTARALEDAGLLPTIVTEGGAEVLARTILERESIGPRDRFLVPQSARARPELKRALEAAGARVDAVALYETLPEERERVAPLLDEVFSPAPPDAVLFASPSAVQAFLELSSEAVRSALREQRTHVVSIGPTTTAALVESKIPVAAEAERPGTEGLAGAVVRALSSSSGDTGSPPGR